MNIKMEKKNSNMKFFFTGNETDAGIVLILFSLYVKMMRRKTGLFNERIHQIQGAACLVQQPWTCSVSESAPACAHCLYDVEQ
jgi:hypothetical protein